MKYKIIKLKFKTAIHLGENDIYSSYSYINCDTIFSALCIEKLKVYGNSSLNNFVNVCKTGKIKISNALPYIGDILYFPKPYAYIENNSDEKDKQENKLDKKIMKKIEYIPINKFEDYISGKLEKDNLYQILLDFEKIGNYEIRTLVSNRNKENSTGPFNYILYRFNDNTGLYCVIAYEDENEFKDFVKMFTLLGMDGIGGKISAGFGKFDIDIEDISKYSILLRLLDVNSSNIVMTIATCLPKEDELKISMEYASYKLIKRGGYVSSTDYFNKPIKKHTLYAFVQGACFKNKFLGDIYNVNDVGRHPVYRYLIPFYVKIN